MAVVGDVFGLNVVYDFQVENVNNNNLNSWPENLTGNPNFLAESKKGYFAAGAPSTTNIYKLDFSIETVSLSPANLPAKFSAATCTTDSYGYLGGYDSNIHKLDYSNETVSTPASKLPPVGISYLGGVSSNSYGYFGGGITVTPTIINTIYRLDFSNDNISSPGNNLLASVYRLATTYSNSYGYFGGGFSPPAVSTIQKIDFSNDNVSLAGNLPGPVYYHAGVLSSSSGYFTVGPSGPSPQRSALYKLDFTSESVSIPGNMPDARNRAASISANNAGYIIGGRTSRTVCSIQKIDFSSESTSVIGATTPTARYNSSGFHKQIDTPADFPGASILAKGFRLSNLNHVKTAGYTTHYQTPSPPTSLLKYTFSTNTWTDLPGLNPTPDGTFRGFAFNNNEYGYFSGSTSGGMFKIEFGTDTKLSSFIGYPNPPNTYSRAVSTQAYGFISNGVSIGRIDFSTDTGQAFPGLPLGRVANATMQNRNYGYFAGGRAPDISNVERWDFSTYVGTTLPNASNAPSPGTLFFTGNTSSSEYGYYFGGIGRSTIRRIDFSTEQNTALPNMPTTSREGFNFSGSYDGYYGGGYASGISNYKLQFGSETISSIAASPGNIKFSHCCNNGI